MLTCQEETVNSTLDLSGSRYVQGRWSTHSVSLAYLLRASRAHLQTLPHADHEQAGTHRLRKAIVPKQSGKILRRMESTGTGDATVHRWSLKIALTHLSHSDSYCIRFRLSRIFLVKARLGLALATCARYNYTVKPFQINTWISIFITGH